VVVMMVTVMVMMTAILWCDPSFAARCLGMSVFTVRLAFAILCLTCLGEAQDNPRVSLGEQQSVGPWDFPIPLLLEFAGGRLYVRW
jgi:hypothetical protein